MLQRVSEKLSIWKSSVKRIYHNIRNEGLLQTIVEEIVERKCYVGKPRLEDIQQIIKDQGCDYRRKEKSE